MTDRPTIKITKSASFFSAKLAPVRIDPDTNEVTAGARATGFYWELNGEWYLVTNMHVLTGWDHQNGRSISANGFVPTHLEFDISVDAVRSTAEPSKYLMQRQGKRIPLEDGGSPRWLEHPEFGASVDVAIIPVWERPSSEELTKLGARSILSVPVNRHHEWTELYEPSVSDDAFVLGYPKGMGAKGFPIWKRASIASEPEIDLDGLPKMYIDTATREGMSGSPVIAVHRGFWSPSGETHPEAVIGEVFQFLGVYSGRVGEDELGVQLGIVWKSRVIEEIINGAKTGLWPWNRPEGQGK